MQQAGGDAATYMCEMIKACCVSPKVTDADLDNPNDVPSLEWDWVFAQITKQDLAGVSTDAIKGVLKA